MIVSTRGRYALRVIIDLAEHDAEGYTPLKDISKRQDISQKYLESIMTILSKGELVEAIHGKGGGYRLNRKAEDYKVGDILRLTEKSLAPVACLDCNAAACDRVAECRTLPMWENLNVMINNYFNSVSIADLAKGRVRI